MSTTMSATASTTASAVAADEAAAVPVKAGWGPAVAAGPSWWMRMARAVVTASAGAVTGCRAAVERPVTLAEGLELARRGDWTASEHPMVRQGAVVHFWLVQAPALVVAGVVGWSARTPGRFWTVGPLLVTVASVLDQVPVLGLLVPECVTWSYWVPASWTAGLGGSSEGSTS